MASSVVPPAHLLPLAQIILQQVSDLRDAVGVAVAVAVLMSHGVAAPAGVVVTAITVTMRRAYSSRVVLAVMAGREEAVAMAAQAALQIASVFLVVVGDVVGSSAGLDFVVQLEMKPREEKHEQLPADFL